jgi:hypothetical protein
MAWLTGSLIRFYGFRQFFRWEDGLSVSYLWDIYCSQSGPVIFSKQGALINLDVISLEWIVLQRGWRQNGWAFENISVVSSWFVARSGDSGGEQRKAPASAGVKPEKYDGCESEASISSNICAKFGSSSELKIKICLLETILIWRKVQLLCEKYWPKTKKDLI